MDSAVEMVVGDIQCSDSDREAPGQFSGQTVGAQVNGLQLIQGGEESRRQRAGKGVVGEIEMGKMGEVCYGGMNGSSELLKGE